MLRAWKKQINVTLSSVQVSVDLIYAKLIEPSLELKAHYIPVQESKVRLEYEKLKDQAYFLDFRGMKKSHRMILLPEYENLVIWCFDCSFNFFAIKKMKAGLAENFSYLLEKAVYLIILEGKALRAYEKPIAFAWWSEEGKSSENMFWEFAFRQNKSYGFKRLKIVRSDSPKIVISNDLHLEVLQEEFLEVDPNCLACFLRISRDVFPEIYWEDSFWQQEREIAILEVCPITRLVVAVDVYLTVRVSKSNPEGGLISLARFPNSIVGEYV